MYSFVHSKLCLDYNLLNFYKEDTVYVEYIPHIFSKNLDYISLKHWNNILIITGKLFLNKK